jgi:restriction system protein
MTITEAIRHVMTANGKPMTVRDAYQAIVAANLYEFHAQDPLNVIRNQIRRHCEGIDYPGISSIKHFRRIGDDEFFLIERPK